MTDHNRPVQRRPQGAPARQAQSGPPRPAAPRPAARKRRGGSLPNGFWPLVGVCAGILALGMLLQGLMPNGFPIQRAASDARPIAETISEIHGGGPIRLNEIMTANSGVYVDADGETPDWIEVANIGNRPVSLKGYVLARSAKAGNVFVFPDMILQAGECALVLADSTLRDAVGSELHAPFRLSSDGDVLMLFNDADVAIDTVNIPALAANTAYARQDKNTWTVVLNPTPGLLNTEDNYRAMTTVVQTGAVQLAELVASNTQYAPDENGAFQDYILLRNTSGEAVDLSGWYLSDDPRMPRLWRFPDGASIPAGGTLIVYASGVSRTTDLSHLHAGFRLSSEGETVTLSNAAGQPVDQVTYDLLKTDAAYIRGADGSWSVGTPTM